MNGAFQTVDEYIAGCPKSVRAQLERVRRTIRKAAPGAVETISYRMPAFALNGRNLVYFAAWKSHIGFYPVPSAIEAFKKDLSRYKGAKGSVQFPFDKPIPLALIARIVRFRVRENLKRTGAKRV